MKVRMFACVTAPGGRGGGGAAVLSLAYKSSEELKMWRRARAEAAAQGECGSWWRAAAPGFVLFVLRLLGGRGSCTPPLGWMFELFFCAF